jgi:hypothetical protein
METLASILAGQGANPYQQASQGIAPLLSQNLQNQALAPSQLGQGQQQAPQLPNPQMMPPAFTGSQGQQMPLGLGMLSGNPQAAALMQALQSGQSQGQ